jgi:hypothetical protein
VCFEELTTFHGDWYERYPIRYTSLFSFVPSKHLTDPVVRLIAVTTERTWDIPGKDSMWRRKPKLGRNSVVLLSAIWATDVEVVKLVSAERIVRWFTWQWTRKHVTVCLYWYEVSSWRGDCILNQCSRRGLRTPASIFVCFLVVVEAGVGVGCERTGDWNRTWTFDAHYLSYYKLTGKLTDCSIILEFCFWLWRKAIYRKILMFYCFSSLVSFLLPSRS